MKYALRRVDLFHFTENCCLTVCGNPLSVAYAPPFPLFDNRLRGSKKEGQAIGGDTALPPFFRIAADNYQKGGLTVK